MRHVPSAMEKTCRAKTVVWVDCDIYAAQKKSGRIFAEKVGFVLMINELFDEFCFISRKF